MPKFKLDFDLVGGSKKHKVAVQTRRNQRRAQEKRDAEGAQGNGMMGRFLSKIGRRD